jgi:prolyl oligopeptidase
MKSLLAATVGILALTGATVACAAERASSPADPYIWLEAPHDPAAVAWAEKRTKSAAAELAALPDFPAISQEIKAAENASQPLPHYFLLGTKIARYTVDALHPFGVLELSARRGDAIAAGPWRPVLDVAQLNREQGTNYRLMFFDLAAQCLPPAYERCLLPLARGGSSLIEFREFDLASAQFVPNGFATPPIRDTIAWLNANTLVVGHSLYGDPALPSGFPQVLRLWKRGTPLSSARVIFRGRPTDSFVSVTGLGEGHGRRILISDARDYAHFVLKSVDQRGVITDVDLPQTLKALGTAVGFGAEFVVQLAAPATLESHDYPAESLIAYDVGAPNGRHVTQVFAPPDGAYVNDPLSGLAATKTSVAFVLDRDLHKTLYFAVQTSHGWEAAPSISTSPGVAMHIVAADDDSVLVREEGFLQPAKLVLVRQGGGAVEVQSQKAIIDPSNFVSEVRTARSKDGTPVSYYLVRPKISVGPVPVIVTGYGSYGANVDPTYFTSGLGPSLVSWFKRGGAYALAAVRGGGERGAAWHEAAMGLNKQRSFDDFIAVAQDLVQSGFTVPCEIGNFGRSAGGLLVAGADTEKPDLFGASLVGVPVVDLLRLSGGSGIGGGMAAEFGDASTPAGAAAVLTYSPYQNIRAGVRYPKILVVSSTEDNQVGPGQARKFVAKLASVGAHPLLLEGPLGGHGFPDEYADPDYFAMQMAFFVDALMTHGCVRH